MATVDYKVRSSLLIQVPKHLAQHVRPRATERLPEDLRINGFAIHADLLSFYRATDGISLPGLDTDVLGVEAAGEYARDLEYHPLSQVLGLWPITESNDSNPYCVCLNPRLNGAVLRLMHDGDTRVTHNSLGSFLSALEALVVEEAESIDDCRPNFPLDDRLMESVDGMLTDVLGKADTDDEVLVPLLSACSPAAIVQCLSSDSMWVREEAAVLLGAHVYTPARDALATLSKAGDRQDNRAARASLSVVDKALYAQRS